MNEADELRGTEDSREAMKQALRRLRLRGSHGTYTEERHIAVFARVDRGERESALDVDDRVAPGEKITAPGKRSGERPHIHLNLFPRQGGSSWVSGVRVAIIGHTEGGEATCRVGRTGPEGGVIFADVPVGDYRFLLHADVEEATLTEVQARLTSLRLGETDVAESLDPLVTVRGQRLAGGFEIAIRPTWPMVDVEGLPAVLEGPGLGGGYIGLADRAGAIRFPPLTSRVADYRFRTLDGWDRTEALSIPPQGPWGHVTRRSPLVTTVGRNEASDLVVGVQTRAPHLAGATVRFGLRRPHAGGVPVRGELRLTAIAEQPGLWAGMWVGRDADLKGAGLEEHEVVFCVLSPGESDGGDRSA